MSEIPKLATMVEEVIKSSISYIVFISAWLNVVLNCRYVNLYVSMLLISVFAGEPHLLSAWGFLLMLISSVVGIFPIIVDLLVSALEQPSKGKFYHFWFIPHIRRKVLMTVLIGILVWWFLGLLPSWSMDTVAYLVRLLEWPICMFVIGPNFNKIPW